MTGIAASVGELSPEWLAEALEAEVRSVTVEPIGTGQTSSTYRLTLDADGCARTLVAKLAEGPEDARRRVATAHRNEIGFYRHLAPTLKVRVPECRYAAISDDGTSFTLLLEDLAPRRPGRQADGCSFADATKAVQSLGRLHASRWNDISLNEISFLVPVTEERAAFLADLAQTATDLFVTRYADELDAEDALTLHSVAEVLFEWQANHREPFSLVHGDYRLDNLMLDPAGGDVVVVDWQTVTVALPGRDLGYFIGTSLPTEQRRAEEGQLVGTYHEALKVQGVMDYPFDRCWADYRVGQLQGPMITVIGSMTSAGPRSSLADAMFLSMARRSCAAVRDHHSVEAA
jgi:aminoglycoside phosphotransferase (APT) family kinase protein